MEIVFTKKTSVICSDYVIWQFCSLIFDIVLITVTCDYNMRNVENAVKYTTTDSASLCSR